RLVRSNKSVSQCILDVITIDKTNENFRLIYDVKGRFVVHRITNEEASYKLCKVTNAQTGSKGVPFLCTHDGRTIRYPDPHIKVNDTIKLNLESGKIDDYIKFEVGNICMITGGNNLGRIGTLISREKHPGSFEIIHIRDANNHTFATRINYVFVIGKGNKPWVSIPAGKGLRLTIAEDRERKLKMAASTRSIKL
ncbi:hypothetical protein GJ496_002771, partial [Pomphorhynchus laevis]